MSTPARFLAVLTAVVALVSILAQGYVFAMLPEAIAHGRIWVVWIMAGFFTILTNLLVAVVLLAIVAGRWPRAWPAKEQVLGCLVTAITLVGIVYHLLLAKLWNPQGLHWWADQGLHSAVPVLFLIFWFAFAPREGLRPADALRWLIYPFGYFLYAMARGALDGWYPYPFLDVGKLGYGPVLLNAVMFSLAILIGGVVLILVSRVIPRQR